MHKFKVDSIVQHGEDRAKIVGYCMPEEWATEPRYGIELLDRFETVVYSDNSTKDWPIVKAVVESALILINSPTKKEEPSVAEVVSSIEHTDMVGAMASSGVD